VSDVEREQLLLGPTEFVTKARVQPQEVEALVRTMLRRYTTTGSVAVRPQIHAASARVQ
jgi:hypothetical protein